MIAGQISSRTGQICNAFWSGGIPNPIEAIAQDTHLLFLRRLGDLRTLEENKAAQLKRPMARCVFAEGNDPSGRPLASFATLIAEPRTFLSPRANTSEQGTRRC
jgi:type I restriction enzyme M protein